MIIDYFGIRIHIKSIYQLFSKLYLELFIGCALDHLGIEAAPVIDLQMYDMLKSEKGRYLLHFPESNSRPLALELW